MPVYMLRLRDYSGTLFEPDIVELPCLEDAKARALRDARDMISHDIKAGFFDLRFRIDIEDENGNVIAALSFKDAVAILDDQVEGAFSLGCNCMENLAEMRPLDDGNRS